MGDVDVDGEASDTGVMARVRIRCSEKCREDVVVVIFVFCLFM